METYILSCIQYAHCIQSCVMKRCIHSQRTHSYHAYKWDCNDFMTYLPLNKPWKKGMIYIFRDEFKYVIEKKG